MDKSERRVALIAGAGGGIGEAVSRRLARDGIAVWLGGHRNPEARERCAGEIVREGGRADAISLDLRDPESPGCACQEIFDRAGRLDILVNCAAVNAEEPAAGMSDDTWRRVIEVNLDGAFRLCRAAVKFMILGRWGRIVNFSSVSAVRGGRGQINYAASKAGVEALTRVLALELGRKGVLVNCIAPGVIETTLSERIRRDHAAELLEHIALHRFGAPAEVAELAAFFVSDAAAYITGQVVRVDGGMSL
jgi:3-oxoacyl-[acyl-carrier protein] reductase